MTHRERLLAAINHREPDRLPRDLGSTMASTITAGAQDRMRSFLDLPLDAAPVIFSRRSSSVIPDEAILQRFGVDARPLVLGAPELCPDRPLDDASFVDEWGITWSKPLNGHFINTAGPFCRMEEPGAADLARYAWPEPADPGRFRGLRERARALHERSEHAIVLTLGVGPVHQCQFLRGYGEWLEDLIANPAFAEGLIDRVTGIWAEIWTRALEEAADYVDLVMFGDDIATQKGPLFSPSLYRRMVKPYHKRLVEAVKPFGKPVLYHSCGAVYPLVPDLIEVGITILNPIQVSAAHMDTARLKRDFGRDLVFWGAIDNQHVLPHGTPQQVREEVRRRIDDLAAGGGYVLAAAHNIQQDVPPENVAAMFDAAAEYTA